MKVFLRFLGTLVTLVIIFAVIYGLYYVITLKRDLPPVDTTVTPTASSTPDVTATTTSGLDMARLTNVPTTGWTVYTDDQLGYSFKYPGNLTSDKDGQDLVLTLPKDKYFSWPLLDTITVRIAVATTCPPLETGGSGMSKLVDVNLNNIAYKYADVTEGAAGSTYRTVTFETKPHSRCYVVSYNSRSANGASLYVDDQTLIKKYDAEHAANADRALDVYYGIVNSFHPMI